MKRTSRLYKILLPTHKYLGLITGLVVLLVSITGACWVFKEEIEALYLPEYVFPIEEKASLSASQAKEIASKVFPGRLIHGSLFQGEGHAVEVIFYEYEPEFYRSVFLHPYTGEVLESRDHLSGFFAFMLRGHMYLWLPTEIGGPLVKYSIVLFLLIISSGLILWFPQKLKETKKKLRFDWKASTRWRRKNYDLHTIIGAYIYALAFVFAFTGSVVGLPWFYYLAHKAAGGESEPMFIIPANESEIRLDDLASTAVLDQLIPKLQAEEPDALSFELHYPHDDTSSIYVEVSHQEGVYYNSDYRFFDQYTLAEIETPGIYGKYDQADFADTFIRINYDIHVGAIGGLAGKIIAFIASLFVGSLPVSGFLIWYGRRKKSKTRKPSAKSQAKPKLKPKVGGSTA
ncbi:MAG: PepSY-associated TM helix domain-containing protein [Bacteroidota bacterium]